jgi:hypothetical protein
MREKFEEIESQFQELKKKFKQKKISEREFRYRLKKLRLNAPDGRCWTIGARSGKWYYFDGDKWNEADPPSLQQGKAICIYCGFENDIHSEACEYCGGSLDSKQIKCPKCGFVLESPDQTCPVCEITSDKQAKKEKPEEEEKTDDFSQTSWDEIERMEEQSDQEEEKVENVESPIDTITDLNEPNYIARFINPSSFFLLFGIFGLILGLSLGAVVGATSLFSDFIATLPEFFSILQGKIHGGLLFGLFGGLLGLLFLGVVGFLTAFVVNMILSLIGGIKLRIDKIEM